MAKNQNQFVVPQFIEVETKIIGPISGRQFIILLVSGAISYAIFTIFTSPIIFLPGVGTVMAIGAVLAFGSVNGQRMHYFLLNIVQTFKRPRLKVWKRELIKEKQRKEKDEMMKQLPYTQKSPISRSHLAEIALQVDTGGTFTPISEKQDGTS
jgi:hypothetical protein